MDKIYQPEYYRASDNLNLKEYFEEYAKTEQEYSGNSNSKRKKSEKEYLRQIMGKIGVNLDVSEIKKLANICDVDHLTCEDENICLPTKIPKTINTKLKLDYVHKVTANARKLNVIQTSLSSNIDTSFMETYLGFKRKFQSPEQQNDKHPTDMSPGSTFVLLVLLYKPKKYFTAKSTMSTKLQFSHSIEVLGTNLLTDLRDKIICASDTGLCREVQSPHDNLDHLKNAKEEYPSGFFFIDNVFYNDFRHPNAIDYSEVIRKWAKDKGIGEMTTGSMEQTSVNDLKPRLGYPYLYMHQGDCEHIMVFTDVKLIQKLDDLCSGSYPRIAESCKLTLHHQCYLCSMRTADWICQDNARFPQERIFLCTECCESYNYIDEEKVGSFRLYPHFYESV